MCIMKKIHTVLGPTQISFYLGFRLPVVLPWQQETCFQNQTGTVHRLEGFSGNFSCPVVRKQRKVLETIPLLCGCSRGFSVD